MTEQDDDLLSKVECISEKVGQLHRLCVSGADYMVIYDEAKEVAHNNHMRHVALEDMLDAMLKGDTYKLLAIAEKIKSETFALAQHKDIIEKIQEAKDFTRNAPLYAVRDNIEKFFSELDNKFFEIEEMIRNRDLSPRAREVFSRISVVRRFFGGLWDCLRDLESPNYEEYMNTIQDYYYSDPMITTKK